MRVRQAALVVVAGLLVLGAALPAAAKKDKPKPKEQSKRTFELAYTPTSRSDETIDLTGLGSSRPCLQPPGDLRPDTSTIGRNMEEDENSPLPIRTSSSVPEFITTAAHAEFLAMGIPLEPCASATHVLKIDVMQFEVVLDGNYKGSVKLRIHVEDREGKELFAALASGKATRFSIKESAANYLEVLSDSTFDALHSLSGVQGFRESLKQ